MTSTMLSAMSGMILLARVAAAAEPGTVGPMAAFVQDIGGKQVVGYYLAENSACDVTMMVGDSLAEDMPATSAARVHFALPAAASATVESAEGGKLAVTCGPDAGTLVVDSHPAANRLASR